MNKYGSPGRVCGICGNMILGGQTSCPACKKANSKPKPKKKED